MADHVGGLPRIARMKRPAYGLLVGVAVLMGVVALVVSHALDERLRDPDGFLGPAWVRLPAMVLGAFLLDVVPRSLWRARSNWRNVRAEAATVVGGMKAAAGVAALEQLVVKDPDPFVRRNAAWALGQLGASSSKAALTTASTDKSGVVRGVARAALASIK